MTAIRVSVADLGTSYEIRTPGSPAVLWHLRKIPSVRYDTQGGCWLVAKKDALCVREFCDLLERKRLAAVTMAGEGVSFATDMPDLQQPHGLLVEPYRFQRSGIRYMLEKKRCFNCDDMGCGKTLEAIAAVHIAKAFPCLVVCPAAMKVTWQREFRRFTGRRAVVLGNDNAGRWQGWCATCSCDVFITNYESLRKFLFKNGETLPVARMFRSVIADESHRLKDATTQWAHYMEKVCRGREYVFLLTGTPVVTSNKDLVSQLRIMGRLEDFGGARRFTMRYCLPGTPPERLAELNWRLWETCFFRRDKAEVLTELPEKTRQYNIVDIDNRERYRRAEEDLIGYLRRYEEADDKQLRKAMRGYVIVQINVLRRVCAEGKMAQALDIISDYVERRIKLIVFTAHRSVADTVRGHYRSAVTITGSDSPEEKQQAVDRFQEDDDCLLAVVNIRSGGVGLTLTSACHVLFIEFPWTAADCDQCECRSHRNGQARHVSVTYLFGRDTYDERMYDIIQSERENAGMVTGAVDGTKEKMIDKFRKIYKEYDYNKREDCTPHEGSRSEQQEDV